MTSNAFENVKKLNYLGITIWRRNVSDYTTGNVDLTSIVNDIISSIPSTDGIELHIDVPGFFAGQVNVSRMGKYIFGPYRYDFTTAASRFQIGPHKDVEICGQGQRLTELRATAAVTRLFFTTGYDPSQSGTRLMARRLYFHDMWWNGNNIGLNGYGAEDPLYPTSESFSFHHIWERISVSLWVNVGIDTGRSEYQCFVRNCRFHANGISVQNGVYCDITVEDCVFGQPRDTRGMLTLSGTQTRVINNNFTHDNDLIAPIGTGPDIEWSNPTGQGTGTVFIAGNYHGDEGENAARVKIRIGNSLRPADVYSDAWFIGNWYYGIASQTAIEILNPHANIVFDESNLFRSFATVINDNYTPGVSNSIEGGSAFYSKVAVIQTINPTTRLFTNSGRGFNDVVYPPQVQGFSANTLLVNNYGANQRLRQVNDWTTLTDTYSWDGSVSFTGSQIDPFGTTTAGLLTKPAATPFASAQKRIVLTDLIRDTGEPATTGNGRICVNFWAKAGSHDKAQFQVRDNTNNRSIQIINLSLTTGWQPYRLIVNGLNSTGDIRLYFYPGIVGNSTSGTIYLSHVQVSDVGADFTATSTYP